jgi:sensor histidine kinase YesM
MICLPGVENAIIHGFSDGLTLSPHIDIQFKEEDGLLVVNICDNGKGLPEIFSDKSSFGLRNTRKRMALLSEKTGTKSTFQIINRSEDDPQAKGVCLILGIPTLQPQTPNLNKRKTT